MKFYGSWLLFVFRATSYFATRLHSCRTPAIGSSTTGTTSKSATTTYCRITKAIVRSWVLEREEEAYWRGGQVCIHECICDFWASFSCLLSPNTGVGYYRNGPNPYIPNLVSATPPVSSVRFFEILKVFLPWYEVHVNFYPVISDGATALFDSEFPFA